MRERTKHLEFLRHTAREALWAGDYERALLLYEEGLGLSRAWKDRKCEEIFVCNRIAVLLEMGRNDFDLSTLKEVLLRHPTGSFGAFVAYTAARAHELRRELPKARTYAQMALGRCEEDDEYFRAGSLNLLGNLSVAESDFDGALPLYREAVSLFEDCAQDTSREVALAEDNIGYIYIARDEVSVGVPMVDRALSQLESLGARQATTYPCLDLCLGHLKMEEYDEAEHWGVRALALGQEFVKHDVVKNSHYLLGEIYSETDRGDDAERHFEALSGFYPEFPSLKTFLHQVNLVGMINLRA
jgi:tetratricopeptide (TPR) repeat protein